MALNLDTPLKCCKIVFEIVFFINIYPIKKEKNAKQSIFNEKSVIVLHTPHSDAQCLPGTPNCSLTHSPQTVEPPREKLPVGRQLF